MCNSGELADGEAVAADVYCVSGVLTTNECGLVYAASYGYW